MSVAGTCECCREFSDELHERTEYGKTLWLCGRCYDNPKAFVVPMLRRYDEAVRRLRKERLVYAKEQLVSVLLVTAMCLAIGVGVFSLAGRPKPVPKVGPTFILPPDCTEESCPHCRGKGRADVKVVVDRFATKNEDGTEGGEGLGVSTVGAVCPLCGGTGKVARHKSGCLRLDAYARDD